MWFKNLVVYRLNKWSTTPEALEAQLSRHPLLPCNRMDSQSRGWVPPKAEGGPFVHAFGHQMLISLGVEQKLLPTAVVNQTCNTRAAEIEAQQGYKPGRKQMRQIKEAVTDELLPRAFVMRRKTYAWIDPIDKWLVVDTASLARADEFIEMLIRTQDAISLAPIKCEISPKAAMTGWLAGDDLPSSFTIDRDCELRVVGDEKSTVRYVRHPLDTEDVTNQIKAGKEVTKLALTWNSNLSFVLNDNLQLKRIAPLDILREQTDYSEELDMFDSDFAIMIGELKRLLPGIVSALGGEL